MKTDHEHSEKKTWDLKRFTKKLRISSTKEVINGNQCEETIVADTTIFISIILYVVYLEYVLAESP